MNNYLVHYGIKGQQWGTRRWQYEDGSYTPAGEEHYRKQKKLKGSDSKKTTKKSSKKKKNNKIEHGVITGENYSVRYIL